MLRADSRAPGVALVLVTVLLVAVVASAGCTSPPKPRPGKVEGVLTIFHHGSIRVAVDAVEKEFKATHPGITEVKREKSPSGEAIRKVTEQGKVADIVMSGDYNLINNLMVPNWTSWWVRYSTDSISIAFTNKSRYAGEITADNWYQILRRPDVKWGFADPNVGPDGYFALAAVQLAELKYGDSRIFDDLVVDTTAISSTESGGITTLRFPEDLAPDPRKVIVRNSPTNLLPYLSSGELDFVFQYYSEAVSNKSLRVLALPKEINLADTAMGPTYAKVHVVLYADSATRSVEVTIGVKANGFTIPKNAANPAAASAFLKILLGKTGQDALSSVSITPVVPAETNAKTKVPADLQSSVRQLG